MTPSERNGPMPGDDQQSGQICSFTEKNHTKCYPVTKWRRVLTALLSGRSFNRFEAERELHEHCLHSTVAELQGKLLTIHRREETIPGYMGAPTRVMRYWLAPESRQMAEELLGRVDHAK